MNPEALLNGVRTDGVAWAVWVCSESGDDSVLSEAEQERAARFRREEDRRAFVAGRQAVRAFLSRWFGTETVPLEVDGFGRPVCPLAGAPDFNLSHAAGWLALAVSTQGRVGIDLEDLNRNVDWKRLSVRYFSEAEQTAVRTGGRQAFFEVWTRKEALAKAMGTGLRGELREYDTLSSAVLEVWRFVELTPKPEMKGAVAVPLQIQ